MADKKNKLLLTILLLVILVILILNNLFYFSGYYGYDDVTYSRYANDIITGNFSLLDNQFSYRWSAIFTTALAYKIFGYNDFARAIFPIISTVFSLFLISLITKYKNNEITFIAIILTITNQWYFYYSDKIMADIYVALSFTASIVILFYYKFYKKDKPILFALLLGISLIFGFISKGTIVLIAPVIGVIFINDILKKQNFRFWILTIGFSLAFLFIYFVSIKIITGTYLMRFYVINANSYLNPCSYDQLPTINTIKRISYELFYGFLNSGLFIPIILSTPLLNTNRIKNIFNTNNKSSFVFLAIILSLLSANFMTISFRSYIPMCADIRHYLFLIPLLSISGAIGLYKFLTDKKINYFVLALFIIAALILYLTENNYLIYTLIFGILLITKIVIKNIKIGITIISLTLFTSPLLLMIKASEINWSKHVNIIDTHFTNTKNNLVITNKAESNIINIYSRFDKSITETFGYKEIEEIDFSKYDNVWWFNYWFTDFYNKTKYEDIPLILKSIDSTINYTYINDGMQVIHQNKPIVFYNNYEDYAGNWSINKDYMSDAISLSGNSSNFITKDGYSASLTEDIFTLKLDSLNRFARISVNYLSIDTSFAQLVISIEDEGKSILWKGTRFSEFHSSENKWNKVLLETKIPNIKSGKLKVYVWNTGTDTVWIDNLKVILF